MLAAARRYRYKIAEASCSRQQDFGGIADGVFPVFRGDLPLFHHLVLELIQQGSSLDVFSTKKNHYAI